MAEPTQIFFTAPFHSGRDTGQVEGWGNSPDTEIVANLYQNDEEPHGPDWVLTHRRTGRKINDLEFPTMNKALAFASMIEGIEDFKRIGAGNVKENPKWGDVNPSALRGRIERLHEEFQEQEAKKLAELIYG